jgi:DNA-binding NarL/FixJ family response regulator
MASNRPPQICVRMVGEESWASKIAQFLEDHIGAAVKRDATPPTNGTRDAHVFIVSQRADPGFKYLRNLRKNWSERELPVIVMADDDDSEVEAMTAGASAFIDESMHHDGRLLEKLVYGLAYEG